MEVVANQEEGDVVNRVKKSTADAEHAGDVAVDHAADHAEDNKINIYMGNMIIVALVLDEQRKQKERLKEMVEKENFGEPLLEPLLASTKLKKG